MATVNRESKAMQVFERNVRKRMKELGLTFRAMAEKMDCTAMNIHSAISGKSSPSLEKMERIAAALDTPLHHLLDPAEPEEISA